MKTDVLGVKINTESRVEILDQISQRLGNRGSTFIVTPYSETLVAAQNDSEFRNILNAADFALPDGAGVIWASKGKIQKKIPGREFFLDLCGLAQSRGESIFLLGGYGNTPELVANVLYTKFPNINIAGTCNGGAGIVEQINSKHADFLFVALGPIRQEKWIARNLPKLHVKLVMGVGGTFDYLAGKRPLPPQILASYGLEWLWRLITQPWRFRRISKGILSLIWYAIRARVRR